MKDISKQELLAVVKELIQNCEGAVMAASSRDYLHNFAFMLQQKLRSFENDLETHLHDDKTPTIQPIIQPNGFRGLTDEEC